MKRWAFWSAACFALVLCVILPLGCSGDDGDDDDDSGTSYGDDISDVYTVEVSYTEDTCSPNNVGADPEEWIVTIEQSKDLGWAWIYYQQVGADADETELFNAKVYGTVVVKASVDEYKVGENCVKFMLRNYYVDVDKDGGNNTLSGRLIDDVFYQGSGCGSSEIPCQYERVITSTSK